MRCLIAALLLTCSCTAADQHSWRVAQRAVQEASWSLHNDQIHNAMQGQLTAITGSSLPAVRQPVPRPRPASRPISIPAYRPPPIRQQEEGCRNASFCVRILELLDSSNYCQTTDRGQRDYIPVFRNSCAEKVACKICSNADPTDCQTWTFDRLSNFGGWASPLVWCDTLGLRWTCYYGPEGAVSQCWR